MRVYMCVCVCCVRTLDARELRGYLYIFGVVVCCLMGAFSASARAKYFHTLSSESSPTQWIFHYNRGHNARVEIGMEWVKTPRHFHVTRTQKHTHIQTFT